MKSCLLTLDFRNLFFGIAYRLEGKSRVKLTLLKTIFHNEKLETRTCMLEILKKGTPIRLEEASLSFMGTVFTAIKDYILSVLSTYFVNLRILEIHIFYNLRPLSTSFMTLSPSSTGNLIFGLLISGISSCLTSLNFWTTIPQK